MGTQIPPDRNNDHDTRPLSIIILILAIAALAVMIGVLIMENY